MDHALPQVAIVGRPNVGKSSLLNMLARRRISIVEPTAGVTRDRVSAEVELPPGARGAAAGRCEVVDTGGYGVYSGDERWGSLTQQVERQIAAAVDSASLILFVVDAQSGLTPLDQTVAQLLRRRVGDLGRVLVVVNKVDDRSHEPGAMEAAGLGFGDVVLTSANSKQGRAELLDLLAERLGDRAVCQSQRSEMLLAIVGRRNAGKSTLVNTLAGAERVIASQIPGTTRDSVDVRFRIGQRTFTAIDTAGVRKRKSLADDIEYYSLHRALRSIRRADVVVLLIDATEPVGMLEKQLGAEIVKHHKPCVIAVNKWDLVKDRLNTDDFLPYLDEVLRGLDFAPIAYVSAQDNDNVKGLMETAIDLHAKAGHRVGTAELNAAVQDIFTRRGPSPRLGREAKVYYATMLGVCPPTIALFVNYPNLFDAQYTRYLLNQFRLRLPYEEVPIKLLIRARKRDTPNRSGTTARGRSSSGRPKRRAGKG